MSDEVEIQISTEVEASAIDDFHETIMTGSYREIIDAWAKMKERIERMIKHSKRIESHFFDYHEIKDKENHILISNETGFEIIDVSMEETGDLQ